MSNRADYSTLPLDWVIRSPEPDRWSGEREQFNREEEARREHITALKILRASHLKSLARRKKMNGRKETNV